MAAPQFLAGQCDAPGTFIIGLPTPVTIAELAASVESADAPANRLLQGVSKVPGLPV